jgi:hypothetical protein
MGLLADSENSQDREALSSYHENRAATFAPQSVRLTVRLQYDAPLGMWFAILTDDRDGHVVASFRDWSSLDVLREAALVADRATVQR